MGATTAAGVEPLPDVQIGSGTELVATTRQFSQGTVTETGNRLDVAINGEGFFQVLRPTILSRIPAMDRLPSIETVKS